MHDLIKFELLLYRIHNAENRDSKSVEIDCLHINFEELSPTARGAKILTETVIGTVIKLLFLHHCPPGNEHSHGL